MDDIAERMFTAYLLRVRCSQRCTRPAATCPGGPTSSPWSCTWQRWTRRLGQECHGYGHGDFKDDGDDDDKPAYGKGVLGDLDENKISLFPLFPNCLPHCIEPPGQRWPIIHFLDFLGMKICLECFLYPQCFMFIGLSILTAIFNFSSWSFDPLETSALYHSGACC